MVNTRWICKFVMSSTYKVKGESFVLQQINPTGVVQKLFIIDVSALKPFSRYIQITFIEYSK